MFLKSLLVPAALLGSTAIASPPHYSSSHAPNSARSNQPPFKPSDQKVSPARGPSYIFSKPSTSVLNLETESVAAYSLQESYDASNWFSKFSVQAVRVILFTVTTDTNALVDWRSDS